MGYEVTPIESVHIYHNLVELGKKTTIWPHPEELFLGGSKIQGYETLRLASLSMGISTPLLVIVEDEIHNVDFLNAFGRGKISGVLKRDYSMKGAHVLTSGNANVLDEMKKAIKNEERTWKEVEPFFGRPKWFIQPFIAHLKYVGEVRTFIVEGRIIYHVTTTPVNNGHVEVTDSEPLRPLSTHL